MDTTISIIFFVVGIFAFSYFLEVITKGKYLPTKEENEILLLCVTIPLLSILIWVQFDNFHLMSWSYLIGFTIVSSQGGPKVPSLCLKDDAIPAIRSILAAWVAPLPPKPE